jgi:hypothetical protein
MVLFVSCLFVVLGHDVLFAGRPELFNGGAELWDLFYQLCLAFAASYIFYIVVVRVKRRQDKENIRPFLSDKTRRICEQAKQLIDGLRGGSVSRDDPAYYPSYEEVKSLCEHIRAHDPAPHLVKGRQVPWNVFIAHFMESTKQETTNIYAVPWHEFMTHLMNTTKQEITNIYAVSHLLDTDYLKLLMDIEECEHFAFLEMSGYALDPDLSFFAARQIYHYIEKVRALEQYSERTFNG